MDRRIEKSKQAIMGAFIKLMSEKDFEKITINEIAEEANVNRGTVYLHYEDKFDLMNKCIDTHLNQLCDSCISDGESSNFDSKTSLLHTFQYLEKHAIFYSNMLTNKAMPAFRERILTMALKSMEEHLDMTGSNENISKDIMAQYVASAAVGVMEWWIVNSMPYPAAYMAEQLWQLLKREQIEGYI
ncbi:TetR/AcrR family transcriptional regulator [Clostridium beijerinckii]|uniref:AcrR family transcriptional regulator n=1 Tax=Clostridium beijerinckii TaxID=1520 RepID=A0AAX0AWJ0_CLOBE|nr:TetR/AcrR family transcriptional regulator [Clostridium beijerinckii]NRT87251.1 AcrR family transcriptional regulator [Clostridium beijerinckii]NYC72682.1 AcrR family transcriptional regulator [Clostridium beijerinckii]